MPVKKWAATSTIEVEMENGEVIGPIVVRRIGIRSHQELSKRLTAMFQYEADYILRSAERREQEDSENRSIDPFEPPDTVLSLVEDFDLFESIAEETDMGEVPRDVLTTALMDGAIPFFNQVRPTTTRQSAPGRKPQTGKSSTRKR